MEMLAGVLKKIKKRPFTSAVVLAAGSSERMGGIDKTALRLSGKPVLARALEAFERCGLIDEIIVVTRSEKIAGVAELCQEYDAVKATKIIVGGRSRQESALSGLSEIDDRAEFVAIHDGARPLVSSELIEAVLKEAYEFNAAAPFVPVSDTIKEAKGEMISSTPNRGELVAVQTPQCFSASLIKGAITSAVLRDEHYSDDCAAVEALSVPVRLVPGEQSNIKITTPLDIELAEAIISWRGTGR